MSADTIPPPRALLCCEAGEGRGHVTTLATVARALAPHARSQALLARMEHADMLAPLCDRVDRGLYLDRLPGLAAPGVLRWSGWLRAHGFGDAETLRSRFDWCCAALNAIRPALVVGDYAPMMLLAARAMGIPTVATGAAFGLPPAPLPRFPDLLTPEQAADHGTHLNPGLEPDEDAMRDTINATLGPIGLKPLTRLPEIYACDLSLPRGVPLWDPYAPWRDRPLLLPLDALPPMAQAPGSGLLVYLPMRALKDPGLQAALVRLPCTATVVVPSPDMAPIAALRGHAHLRIVAQPLAPAEVVARCAAILCAGQAGTLALAALAGVPVLALPTQHEQLSNALRAAAGLRGCRVLPRTRRTPEALLAALCDLLSDPEPAQAARSDAQRLRATYAESARDSYSRLLPPLLRAKPPRPLFPLADAR